MEPMEVDNGTDQTDLKVGDRVIAQQTLVGTVRFIGETKFRPGLWIGVELDVPSGKNDGSVQNERYFTCTSPHGLFLRTAAVQPFSSSVIAASKLQSHVRKMLARKRVNGIQASRTWNLLDAHNEDLGLRRGRVIERATKGLRKKHTTEEAAAIGHARAASIDVDDDGEMEDAFMDLDTMTVEELHQRAREAVGALTVERLGKMRTHADYEGPHLDSPLTLHSVLSMMDSFKHDHMLHYKHLMTLLLKARKLFGEEKTLQEINFDPDCTITVVGDLHGQLQDLFTILKIKGVPGPKNWYLFNGDFVDRGPKGVEVFATLCAFKILFPTCVFLNRGNHEARAQNAWMGFEEEVLTKYCCTDETTLVPRTDRVAALKLYILFQSVFDNLPLCSLIQERIFVSHGGLFRNDGVSLNHLRKVSRKREPPLEGRSFEDKVYEDLLWSDPRPTLQYPRPLESRRQSERGAGCEFGPRVTHAFCSLNQVALVVRSHECVPEGFELLHNGRLITIFSASRYCGTQTNKGAYITFDNTLQPEIQQFYAHAVEESESFMTDDQRESKLEEDAVHMIMEYVVDKRLDLYWYFTQNDAKHTGKVSRVEWATAMQDVLGLNVPFLHYQPHLADCDNDGKINYSHFLSRFRVQMRDQDSGWQDAIVRRVCEKLYGLVGGDLKGAYNRFDTNQDGYIGYDEFVGTLKSLDVGLSEQQIFELMQSVDVNDDAHIDFNEFVDRFQVVFNSVGAASADVGKKTKRTSSITPDELRDGVEAAAAAVTAAATEYGEVGEVGDGVAHMQVNTDSIVVDGMSDGGEISANAPTLEWHSLDDWTLQHILKIGKAIYASDRSLSESFRLFDKDGNGVVTLPEFITATGELGLGFTSEEATRLYNAVDADASKFINYEEFVAAFQIEDKDPRSTAWKEGVVQQVSNTLYQHRIHLRAAFRLFDSANCGIISAHAFQEGMLAVNKLLENPLSPVQIDELRKALDRNGDGRIDYREFFEGLAIQDTNRNSNSSA